MPSMTPSRIKTVRMPPEIEAALDAYCAAKQITISQLLLSAALQQIGRPELIEAVRPPYRPKVLKAAKKRVRRPRE
jgi:hypothetical protein